MGAIRPPAMAGRFYPGEAEVLGRDVKQFLSGVPLKDDGKPSPKALIAPHAGYVYSGAVAASAYAKLLPARDIIQRVILLGPCHRVAVKGIAASSAEAFRTPLGDVAIDQGLQARALELPFVSVFDATHAQEHSLEVHIPFLQAVLPDFQLLPLVVGQCAPGGVARLLDHLWGGPETLIVVSSDLSHYHPYEEAKALDGFTAKAIAAFDPDPLTGQHACGHFPVSGLLTLAKRRGMEVGLLDIRNSGDTAGTKDKVVGYGSWAFWEKEGGTAESLPKAKKRVLIRPQPKQQSQQSSKGAPKPTGPKQATPATDFETRTRALLAKHGALLLRIAAASIQNGLATGGPAKVNVDSFPPELRAEGACFVTLKKQGRLRGCIGSPQAYRPLIVDVVENGFRAGFNDPRFPKLSAAERDDLLLSISVLSPSSPMSFKDQADLLNQLRPGIDGLIIQDGARRALFLPSVWEQLPDKLQFLSHLRQKAGMKPDHWSPGFQARRFIAAEIKASDIGDPRAIWPQPQKPKPRT
ncbi:MAG: AmmeMemoRadiSam system protein B [Magnetovibrionaceae bacterium]